MRRILITSVLLAVTATRGAAQQQTEALWYLRGNESVQDFVAHADRISAVAPQVFGMDSTGAIGGHVDPRVVAAAKTHHVKLIPLVMNDGFSQPAVHRVLTNPKARANALRSLAALCRVHHFDGIQFDIENIHVSDRDAFTSFARNAADSVHHAGCTLSAAVVPRAADDPGPGSYDRWIFDNWRGAYDYRALARSLDFLSYMTYAEHTGATTPGPVQGYPWTVACLKYLLSLGVPASKVSLGIATYSDWWLPSYDAKTGPRGRGHDIGYRRITTILETSQAQPQWDDVQKALHAEWSVHGIFQHAWIEDARAFAAKRALVQQYGLRGYSVWVLGLEDPRVWELR